MYYSQCQEDVFFNENIFQIQGCFGHNTPQSKHIFHTKMWHKIAENH